MEHLHSNWSAVGIPVSGESIVWQCTNQLEFQTLILPLTIQSDSDHRLCYICFGSQPAYDLDPAIITTYYISAADGFEAFVYQVYTIISAAEPGTCFLFDFLSVLQTSWVSDLMMANFLRILCPLFKGADCSGIFPLLREQHSLSAIRRIIKSADIFIDLQIRDEVVRLKQFGDSGKQISYYRREPEPLQLIPIPEPDTAFTKAIIPGTERDLWNRYFKTLAILAKAGILAEQEHQKICVRLMTQETQMKELIVKHFTPDDYLSISRHLVGTGKIGGKACGYLLSRKLIETYLPDTADRLIAHDSWFIGTDVFYSYMVDNNCWHLRLKHRLEQEQFEELETYRQALQNGRFPPAIRRQFCKLLLHFGDTPIILRSSSFLEDGYGNAFSGKYESVFCTNQGTLKERLYELERAIRRIYVSTLSPSALAYRARRDLLGQDEQMALLVQSVSGKRFGDLYFPLAAGVSFSYNPYRFMEHINPHAGMARLVAGLGTRAVNRTPGDYPKLVGLDRPGALLWSTTGERHKFSQRFFDAFNLATGRVEELSCQRLLEMLSAAQQKLVFSHDTEAEEFLQQQGRHRQVCFVDCQAIVNDTAFIKLLKQSLQLLEKQYGCPVDIEFALDLLDDGRIGLDLLQCRPLKHNKTHSLHLDKNKYQQVLFDIRQASIRSSKEETIDLIVVVDPKGYYETPHNRKPMVAAAVGRINRQLKDRQAMLMVPGRIGTSSPELGVPVNYAEISQFKALCEIAYHEAGYHPELSYGSHMFQDLVEADVFYAAINEDRSTKVFQPEVLKGYHNLYEQMCPGESEFDSIIYVYDLSDKPGAIFLDAHRGHALCVL